MRKTLLAASLAFLLGVVVGAAGVARAQVETPKPVLSTEVAVRITGHHHGRVFGKLMAKVGDDWVEVLIQPETVPASSPRR